MTKIIGHRGAKGVELENSLASIRMAVALPIDAVEFDVHRTRDGKLVVIHDPTTRRVADRSVRINNTTLKDLHALRLKNGQHIPSFDEVLEIAQERPIFIDIKDKGSAEGIVAALKRYPKARVTFLSFRPEELEKLLKLLPDAQTVLYSLKARTLVPRPIKLVRTAQRIGTSGVAVDKLFMNPLTYRLVRQAELEIYVYSVNSVSGARRLLQLYPDVNFITGNPALFSKAFKEQS